MTYFSRFPLFVYDMKNNGNYKLLPDILRRVKARSQVISGRFLFDSYDVKNGERPEDVAFKFYGDAELHWVVLLTNNVTDRFYQWPMTQPQFDEFLTDKYGAGNEDGVHHYEITQSSGPTTGNGPDDLSHKIEVNETEAGAESVSNFEFERRLQDKKRQIKLLDPRYLPMFLEEFERLIRR